MLLGPGSGIMEKGCPDFFVQAKLKKLVDYLLQETNKNNQDYHRPLKKVGNFAEK